MNDEELRATHSHLIVFVDNKCKFSLSFFRIRSALLYL